MKKLMMKMMKLMMTSERRKNNLSISLSLYSYLTGHRSTKKKGNLRLGPFRAFKGIALW